MKRMMIFLGLGLGMGLLFLLVTGMVNAGDPADPETTPTQINTGRQAEWGIIKTEYQSVFGPHLCVLYGDPFSSFGDPRAPIFRETWRGDATDRTYHYVIKIPPDYPDDVVRVELFDPDSKNQPNNNGNSFRANVVHTIRAVEEGMPESELLSCDGNQKNPCLIDTQENQLGLDLDFINLWWFARIDENRGYGPPPGNPIVCSEPPDYLVGYNTITLYELLYLRQEENGGTVRTELAKYYGQSGDPSRDVDIANDTTDHVTDLRWVSPGGQTVFDQPAPAPTECGSPNGGDYHPVDCPGGTPPGYGNGFEIELNNDLTDIQVDAAGNRYLYLDVTSISGASENGYDIWAGPDNYVNTVSSDVNVRNVQAHNSPQGHHAHGVEVFALNQSPLNSNYSNPLAIPLTYLGPEYAGQSIYISHYDSDSGAQPPLPFFMDTIDPGDWSLVFAAGDPDPDGGSGRCFPGSCNGQFVTPTYRIDLPDLTDACTNPGDPAQAQVCTPFYGGNLIAQYDGGQFDTYLWHVELPEAPPADPTESCTAFPVALEVGARTLTQEEFDTMLPQFTYPTGEDIPDWRDFWNHPGDAAVPLLDGQEEYLYKLDLGEIPGGFQWLKWNTNITGINGGGNILATSLQWPGNSWDYQDYGDPPQPPPPPFEYTFRGFAEAGDPADRQMHLGDAIAVDAISGGFAGVSVQAVLNEHIDTGRALRLPLWDIADPAIPGAIRAAHFGIFRIIGYSTGNNWLLLELVRLDESCGQLLTPPSGRHLVAPGSSGVTTDGVNYDPDDVLLYDVDSTAWSLLFDGGAAGLSGSAIDAVLRLNLNKLLLSFADPANVPGLGLVDDSDVVQYEFNSGTFSLFFDGSDVGLHANSEDVDALARTANGRLLISTSGPFLLRDVNGNPLTGDGADLVTFIHRRFGEITRGRWQIYFDGSDVGLSGNGNIDGATVAANGDLYLSPAGSLDLEFPADGDDILICTDPATGPNSACNLLAPYWDATPAGLGPGTIYGLQVEPAGEMGVEMELECFEMIADDRRSRK